MSAEPRISRRAFIGGLVGVGASILAGACAGTAVSPRPSSRLWRIGFLSGQSPTADAGGALRQALTDLGYVEGREFVIELRYAEGDPERLPGLAAELVTLPVDLIVTTAGGNPVRAAKDATRTIPIVFTGLSDPVGQGLVPNLARPGGNVTGVAGLAELSGKRLEFLRDTVPSLTQVAVLYHASEAGQLLQLRSVEDAARRLGIDLLPVANETVDELYAELDTVLRRAPHGLIDCHGGAFYGRGFTKFGPLLDFAIRHRLPQVFQGSEAVRAGGLMGLGPSVAGRYRVVARLVERILKGADPGTLPVQVVDALELTVNLSMAGRIGITFPERVLRQATEVIQ